MQYAEPAYDPIIGNYYKRIHAASYQEVMGIESDKLLFRAGVIPERVYENDGTEA